VSNGLYNLSKDPVSIVQSAGSSYIGYGALTKTLYWFSPNFWVWKPWERHLSTFGWIHRNGVSIKGSHFPEMVVDDWSDIP